MKQQIPNVVTLLNLLLGCLAITAALQSQLLSVVTETGETEFYITESLVTASICIGLAAVVDFFDGFIARLLKVHSEMGKQLDSLSDVVSFGVAPSIIVYQFIRLSLAQQSHGLQASTAWLVPAFLLALAGAYRLARFNIDTEQTTYFKGIPVPAAGLVVAAFPLIQQYNTYTWVQVCLQNVWFWYGIIALLSTLMVSSWPMMAFKFSNYGWAANKGKYLFLAITVVLAIFLQWLAVPVLLLLYVALSLLFKPNV
ncbi:MAG: CDP-alcohol phosphatidyltransferase [Bacteroidetes bacterium]|nr:MAG: CDP-alcohol phosphatidyltransferase [Bacteroidota bacterium]TAE64837.1 MAG: CDP-alcohol phosphatidyltransferase [Bacteroidota bacterium]TAF96165.1 MAG: CDP-alcohol phosphatidyltransferase [Bacteroidota bacterium]